jgi:hypothetical protein
MLDGFFFADVELPFHVWVREGEGDKARWVLREAPGFPMGARGPHGASDSGNARGAAD